MLKTIILLLAGALLSQVAITMLTLHSQCEKERIKRLQTALSICNMYTKGDLHKKCKLSAEHLSIETYTTCFEP